MTSKASDQAAVKDIRGLSCLKNSALIGAVNELESKNARLYAAIGPAIGDKSAEIRAGHHPINRTVTVSG